jgi:nicotinamidase-related amidase
MKSALLLVDVQQSFLHRPYWDASGLQPFLERLQSLIDRAQAAGIPRLQVFHVENETAANPFSLASGFVKAFSELRLEPTDVFYKSVHSAMFASNAAGQSIDYWLRRHGIDRLVITGIRTEQCCETTTRHASDLGYEVVYATDATLTFPMVSASGRQFSAADIRERTELVLAGRFAKVMKAEAVPL